MATYIASWKWFNCALKKSNIDGAVKNEQNAQYWYAQYKCAFILTTNYSLKKKYISLDFMQTEKYI